MGWDGDEADKVDIGGIVGRNGMGWDYIPMVWFGGVIT